VLLPDAFKLLPRVRGALESEQKQDPIPSRRTDDRLGRDLTLRTLTVPDMYTDANSVDTISGHPTVHVLLSYTRTDWRTVIRLAHSTMSIRRDPRSAPEYVFTVLKSTYLSHGSSRSTSRGLRTTHRSKSTRTFVNGSLENLLTCAQL
jgi:hypothetical protein